MNSWTSLKTALSPWYQVIPACSYCCDGGDLNSTVTSTAYFPFDRAGALRTSAFLTVVARPGWTRISSPWSECRQALGFSRSVHRRPAVPGDHLSYLSSCEPANPRRLIDRQEHTHPV